MSNLLHIIGTLRRPRRSRPPLGLRPLPVWLDDRREEITAAMARYRQAGEPIPPAWSAELAAQEQAWAVWRKRGL
ncbi:hypothetical protein [Allorhodopirellula heiligendammensis]|uniref:Uncharacterized protein n=1 Tax=Allorhodopirellula heiligendammensis TaxID=2714739 RepID=A0A5C6C2X6_9BACT|nr:hypothetical protein [Allorhodopirellula heiligendammensis]TWU18011.1 hypothetical protein Poly21_01640 [Allorhodopirellula heiligendammensis]